MAEYDDDQIGPLEETNEEKEIGEIENIILETAINEFDTKHRSATKKWVTNNDHYLENI